MAIITPSSSRVWGDAEGVAAGIYDPAGSPLPPITTIGPPQAGLPPQAITGGKVNPYSPFIDPSTLDKPITDKPLEGVFGGKPLLNSYKDLPGADTWSKYVGQAAVIGVGAIFLLSGLYMFKPATVAVIRNAASV